MHRIVANCFKSIAFAIIFVIVWDIGFYLWRANALNQRMESLAVSLQEVVSKNNYLPSGDYEMFKSLCNQTANDMNNGDTFINGFNINYGRDASCSNSLQINSGSKNIVRYDLENPASYGDIQVVEIGVGINASIWDRAQGKAETEAWSKKNTGIVFTYTYLVPCLKYTTVTE